MGKDQGGRYCKLLDESWKSWGEMINVWVRLLNNSFSPRVYFIYFTNPWIYSLEANCNVFLMGLGATPVPLLPGATAPPVFHLEDSPPREHRDDK